MIKFVLVIIAIILIWGVSIRNRLKQYLVVIDESKESVDIALEKRYDTIFEMMKIAKAYAKHEEKVFTENWGCGNFRCHGGISTCRMWKFCKNRQVSNCQYS